MSDTSESTLPENSEVVSFCVSGQDFCCDIQCVREIRGWSETTVLPHVESYVKGVINLRGSIVPVIDLSERLGLGISTPGARHVIIIVVISDQTVGLLANKVSDIITLDTIEIQPVPDLAEATAGAFISGFIMDQDRMIRKIDLTSILPKNKIMAA